MPRDWLGSGAISARETAERIITETIRRVKLEAKNDPNFVAPATDLSTILASRHFVVPPVSPPTPPGNLNAVIASRVFLRSSSARGIGGRRLTFGTHLTGGSYDGSAAVTLATDAASANTASTIMARGAAGEFASGVATLTGVTLGNGQFYQATRNSGSVVINLMGYAAGTDNVEQVMAGSWTWKDTGSNALLTIESSGRVVFTASTTARSSINLPAGNAPTAPVDGDIWYDGTHFYGRAAGVTIQLDN